MKPVPYTPRGLENNFINGIITLHDGICGCTTPIPHALHLLNKTQETCPGTSEETTLEHGDVDNFEDGDLARLFEDGDAGDDG